MISIPVCTAGGLRLRVRVYTRRRGYVSRLEIASAARATRAPRTTGQQQLADLVPNLIRTDACMHAWHLAKYINHWFIAM